LCIALWKLIGPISSSAGKGFSQPEGSRLAENLGYLLSLYEDVSLSRSATRSDYDDDD